MAKDPAVSPYVQPFGDYLYDPAANPDAHVIRITVNFDNTTHAIIDASVFRSADCLYTKILLGTGADGTPDSTSRVFNLAGFSGTRTVTGSQMSKPPYNISTLEDFQAFQITAGR